MTLHIVQAAGTSKDADPLGGGSERPRPDSSRPAPSAGPEIVITSPANESVVTTRLITVSGASPGVPVGTQLTLYVVTDHAYQQDEDARVGADGKWIAHGVVLGGHPLPYVHRIFAKAQIGGKTIQSKSIKVTKE